MTRRLRIYLAGPEVFLPDAKAAGERKTALCAQYGFEGLFPLESEALDDGVERSLSIYRANRGMILAADGAIFNLTPFRGPSADAGTVFELGLCAGLGKPVFAYSNEDGALLDRMKRDMGATFDAATGRWRDALGMTIEDFGHADNLMLGGCLTEQGRRLTQRRTAPDERFTDLSGFRLCLEHAAQHFRVALE
ncbi:Nucleoside 2-deoxyribosyltransferase [Methylocella tundrae]|uniref:Nucleoside 2-deoxyribosyltransferase n=1 Tax=Methylocella tundrae TaxID=227605 RepID=A0A8B6MBL2_METTU|nr:nucleoside 2-deoxyribosyltransferase [Methylocella tundrae]VTZ52302.1 Nucleoside 2-deoxyribosyltransferase [Methylocella tundrae]